MTMSREGEKEPHKETNQEEETEETHHREEEAEKAATQESASIARSHHPFCQYLPGA